MIEPVALPKFLLGWAPALAVTAVLPEAKVPVAELFVVDLAGLPIPVVTCVIGVLGVVSARPFTRPAEKDLGLGLRLLVTLIMMVLVQLWIIESRPGWLFTFVVAIGLGFSGYSLLELFGDQVKNLLRRAFEAASTSFGKGSNEP